jgi:hypothetical protein
LCAGPAETPSLHKLFQISIELGFYCISYGKPLKKLVRCRFFVTINRGHRILSEFNSHIAPQIGSERSFGVVFAVVFTLIGFYPLINGQSLHVWAVVIAVIILILGLALPKVLALPNRLWFKLGILLGSIISPIVMTLVFCITVVPVGLLMRLAGKDILRQKLDKQVQSYWIKREEPVGSMKNQF